MLGHTAIKDSHCLLHYVDVGSGILTACLQESGDVMMNIFFVFIK